MELIFCYVSALLTRQRLTCCCSSHWTIRIESCRNENFLKIYLLVNKSVVKNPAKRRYFDKVLLLYFQLNQLLYLSCNFDRCRYVIPLHWFVSIMQALSVWTGDRVRHYMLFYDEVRENWSFLPSFLSCLVSLF